MEGISRARTFAITAVAPAAWGSTYWVTAQMLPPDRPLSAAVVRALPAGLAMLALRRQLPRGDWWWRSAVLGALTIGLFFPCVFIAGTRLPSGLAATLTATSPLVVMGLAWLALREQAGTVRVMAAVVGAIGVALLVVRNPGGVDLVGVMAAAAAVLTSGAGFVLVKYWAAPGQGPMDSVTLVSWQLLWGGLLLLPPAAVVEGVPPSVDASAAVGLAYIATVGTGLAYVCWFYGLARMTVGAVALVGLLNPVVGTLLGVVLAGELFGPLQALGMLLVLGGVAAGQLVRQPPDAAVVPPAGRPLEAPALQRSSRSDFSGTPAWLERRSARSLPTAEPPPKDRS